MLQHRARHFDRTERRPDGLPTMCCTDPEADLEQVVPADRDPEPVRWSPATVDLARRRDSRLAQALDPALEFRLRDHRAHELLAATADRFRATC